MPYAIQIRQTGGPEVLNWTAVDVGEPDSGQVRLRQTAAGLNYIDVYHRTGYYPQPLPFIPLFQTGFRRGGFSYLRRRETAGGIRFCRQGYIPALARFSTTTRIGGDVRASFRSNRPYCARSSVAEGLALSDTALLFHYIARRVELEASANELFNVVASGKVRINVNQRFALKDAAEAHRALEARATSGSSILTV
jgi:NADPH:quinone reductase-like Zn-dependent oxidoreductase